MSLDRYLNFETFFISDVSAPLFMAEGFISLVPSQPQTCSVNFNPFHIKDLLTRSEFSLTSVEALGKILACVCNCST